MQNEQRIKTLVKELYALLFPQPTRTEALFDSDDSENWVQVIDEVIKHTQNDKTKAFMKSIRSFASSGNLSKRQIDAIRATAQSIDFHSDN
jgi:CHASE3 domain sensor protein